jgi:hypothetical protein
VSRFDLMSEFRRSFAETGHTEAECLGQELVVSRADLVLHCVVKCGFGARDARSYLKNPTKVNSKSRFFASQNDTTLEMGCSLQEFVAAILSSLRSLKDCSHQEAVGSRRPARTTWSGGLQSASGASIWALSQSEDFVLRPSP